MRWPPKFERSKIDKKTTIKPLQKYNLNLTLALHTTRVEIKKNHAPRSQMDASL